MSLRVRLTVAYALFFALALFLLDTGLYIGARHLLLQNVLDELHIGSRLIQHEYQSDNHTLTDPAAIDIISLRPPQFKDVEEPELYVQVADAKGDIVSRSSNLRGDTLPLNNTFVTRAMNGTDNSMIQRVGSARVLSLVVPLRVSSHTVGVLQVAQSLRQIDRFLNTLLWAFIGGGVIALVAAARGSDWLARAALQPIDKVRATAERILSAADLKERVPETPIDDEFGRLTHTINRMLERIERLFTVQQRFTADIAHDLRTPLAAIRGNLEVLRRGAITNPLLLEESLHDMESEVSRLTRMTNDIVALAQVDAGVKIQRETVQLDDLILEVYRDLRSLCGTHQFHVDLQAQIAIEGDRDRIKQALVNLVGNAFQHTPPQSTVMLRLCHDDEWVKLAVADDGPGIPAEDQPALFDRFYQVDQARSHGGAGLGLAIVKWVAEAHNGRVWVESAAHQGTTFILAFPLRQGATDAGATVTQIYDHRMTVSHANPASAFDSARPN